MSSAESNALPPPRFPPTRRVLWDRTPAGPAHRVPLLAFAPKICLGRAASELARQAQEAQRHPKALRLVLRGSEGSEPETWLAERLDERGLGHDEVALDLGALPETRASEEIGFSTSKQAGASKSASSRCRLAPSMAQTLHRLLQSLPGPSECGAEASCSTEKFWRWAGALAMDRLQGTTQLRLAAKYPKWAFHATALARPLRTLETPLLQALLAPKSSKSLGCGYLTLDQGRQVLCLMQNEALAREVPLVGVWVDLRDEEVSNLPTLAAHPAVWAAAAHFVHQRNAKEKVWVEASTLLIMAAVRHRAMPPEAGLLFAELRFEEEPGEGLYLASMDYDQATLASSEMKLETFTADYSDLVKIADQVPHERATIKAHSSVAETAVSPQQKRTEAGAIGFRPEEPRSEAPRPVEEECSQCGAGYVADARFCSRCGHRRPSTPVQTPMVEMTLAKPLPAVPAWAAPGESSPPAATPSSRRSDAVDDGPLRQIVGQQQLQLGALQQQLQSVQDLLVQLVAREATPPAPPPPPPSPPPVPAIPVPELIAAEQAPSPLALKADACVGDSEVSVMHAATSPMQKNRMVSTGLQVCPVLQDAAVGDAAADEKVPTKALELPKLRDSADTAGGQSPRPMETVSTWASTGGVPRIICPADLSPCRSEDELSDASSVELMMGDFPLTYHGDQIGFY